MDARKALNEATRKEVFFERDYKEQEEILAGMVEEAYISFRGVEMNADEAREGEEKLRKNFVKEERMLNVLLAEAKVAKANNIDNFSAAMVVLNKENKNLSSMEEKIKNVKKIVFITIIKSI